ncbi:hypothetical protein Tco_0068538, partial [Tanacetum coccineum]
MSEITTDRVVEIETTHRLLGADQLIASGERVVLTEWIREMVNTRSGMTSVAIQEMINRRVAEVLEEYENRNIGPIMESEDEHESGNNENGNGGNGNGGNGNGEVGNEGNNNGGNNEKNGNRNWNDNMNGLGARHVARECTYQDFMKCQPLNFEGTEGVV